MIQKIWRRGCLLSWQIGSYVYLTLASILKYEPKRKEDAGKSKDKIIYLTFDDGPGPYTRRLLKILDRYHVKATFFVTGKGERDIISEIAAAGHSVGNHTSSHKYKEIYSGEEQFYEALYKMEEIIVEKTGMQTKIMRFPGGSSNTCSRFNDKIMTRLTASVQERGYVYFDWNVDSRDAGDARTPGEVYRNIIKGVQENEVSIVLQHDVRPYSVVVVQRVILWGLKNGYVFLPLDENSPTAHHELNN